MYRVMLMDNELFQKDLDPKLQDEVVEINSHD